MHRIPPPQLSHELREEQSSDLYRRRWVVGLSLLGAAMGQAVAAYQVGLIPRLPDPPVGPFDSSRVDASNYAYKHNAPDAPSMIVNYGITAWLASAGGKDRARDNPLLPIATLAKTLADAALTLKLTRDEWAENRALCTYCQVATAASLASVIFAAPEALKAARTLMNGDGESREAEPLHETRRRRNEAVGGVTPSFS